MGKLTVLLAIALIVGTGCFESKPPRPSAISDGRPTYENATLTIGCPDAVMAEKLKPFVAGWAARTKAKVSFDSNPAHTDILICSPVAYGAEAATGAFLPVPDEIKQSTHPYQWSSLKSELGVKVMAWGGQVQGIILGTGADVLIYRNDVLRNGRPLTAAATWEEFLDQAQTLSRDDHGRPVLPPLPTDDAILLHQFHLIAAGFDRQAVQSQGQKVEFVVIQQANTFHHDLSTGAPRLHADSFVAALTLMKQLQAYRPAGKGDGFEAFHSEQVKLAVLSLAELGRLAVSYKGHIPDNLSIAPVPGTRQCLDPATQKLVPAKNGVNVCAYLGDAGFVGAVRKTCGNPTAAFDLLADLGGPSTCLNLVADPALGFGPWRKEQTDPARRDIWNGYGLGPNQMAKLITAVQVPYSGAFDNPVVTPRGPDASLLMTAIAKHIRFCLTGTVTPKAALAATEEEWKQIDARFPKGDPLKWRREAAGLSVVE